MITNLTTSIALCTYNGEWFLRGQLDRYARQISSGARWREKSCCTPKPGTGRGFRE